MVLRKAQDTSPISRVNVKSNTSSQSSNTMDGSNSTNNSSSANNLANFINIASTNEQPSIKRQRIESNSTDKASTSSLDDSGNSSTSTSSSSSSSSLIFSDNELKANGNTNSSCSNNILINNNDNGSSLSSKLSNLREPNVITDSLKFQNALSKQCLCGLNKKLLKRQFLFKRTHRSNTSSSNNHYSSEDSDNEDDNENERQQIYLKSLKNWPNEYIIKLLSNLQLLFNVYLKQNEKGNFCKSIMDLCVIIRGQNHIFEELFEIVCTQNSDKYINYSACKVLTSYLIITKDDKDNNQEWLKKIINNLFNFDNLDFSAVRMINFSLDILKEIVEWKDHDDEHPLDEESEGFTNLPPPPLETNYFATHFNYSGAGSSTSTASQPGTSGLLPSYLASNSGRSSATSGHDSPIGSASIGCQLCHVTDSESFDTTQIKCDAIKFLENKWPALVTNMSSLFD